MDDEKRVAIYIAPGLPVDEEQFANAIIMRGTVLQHFSTVEKIMSEIIYEAILLAPEEFDDNQISTLSGMTTARKKELLQQVFKMFKDRYDVTFPSLGLSVLDQLGQLVAHRNVFAHWLLDTSDDGREIFKNKEVVRFLTLDKSRNFKTEEYTYGQAMIIINRLVEFQKALSAMQIIFRDPSVLTQYRSSTNVPGDSPAL